MTVKVSASIMGHPDRGQEIANLLTALGALGEVTVPISLDQEGPPSGDHDRVWRNARNAWLMHDPSADWHVVLQDDAIVCADLLKGLEVALAALPERRQVVSLYLGQGRTVSNRWNRLAERADETGAAWIRTMTLMWGVAIAIPVPAINDMIAFADRRVGIPDDMRISGWAKRTKLDVWYPWPSLVDHRTVRSLTKHNAMDRIARKFHHGSALDIDWSGTVVTDPMLIRQRGERSGPRQRRGPAQTVVPGR